MLTRLPLLEEVLEHHAAQLGADFVPYRNHAYRVANFCWALVADDGDQESLETISLAAAFHDLGIWTDHTFDYLAPSRRLADAWLASRAHTGSADVIGTMICQHHKITPWRGDGGGLVECFRRADLADVSRGLLRSGLPRELLREVNATFPNAGFHRLLLKLSFERLKRHPLDPLPMMRL